MRTNEKNGWTNSTEWIGRTPTCFEITPSLFLSNFLKMSMILGGRSNEQLLLCQTLASLYAALDVLTLVEHHFACNLLDQFCPNLYLIFHCFLISKVPLLKFGETDPWSKPSLCWPSLTSSAIALSEASPMISAESVFPFASRYQLFRFPLAWSIISMHLKCFVEYHFWKSMMVQTTN